MSHRMVMPGFVATIVLVFVWLSIGTASAQTRKGATHDYSVYCQEIEGKAVRGPYDRTYSQKVDACREFIKRPQPQKRYERDQLICQNPNQVSDATGRPVDSEFETWKAQLREAIALEIENKARNVSDRTRTEIRVDFTAQGGYNARVTSRSFSQQYWNIFQQVIGVFVGPQKLPAGSRRVTESPNGQPYSITLVLPAPPPCPPLQRGEQQTTIVGGVREDRVAWKNWCEEFIRQSKYLLDPIAEEFRGTTWYQAKTVYRFFNPRQNDPNLIRQQMEQTGGSIVTRPGVIFFWARPAFSYSTARRQADDLSRYQTFQRRFNERIRDLAQQIPSLPEQTRIPDFDWKVDFNLNNPQGRGDWVIYGDCERFLERLEGRYAALFR